MSRNPGSLKGEAQPSHPDPLPFLPTPRITRVPSKLLGGLFSLETNPEKSLFFLPEELPSACAVHAATEG